MRTEERVRNNLVKMRHICIHTYYIHMYTHICMNMLQKLQYSIFYGVNFHHRENGRSKVFHSITPLSIYEIVTYIYIYIKYFFLTYTCIQNSPIEITFNFLSLNIHILLLRYIHIVCVKSN